MLCNLVYLKPFFPEPWTCLHSKSNLSANIDSFLLKGLEGEEQLKDYYFHDFCLSQLHFHGNFQFSNQGYHAHGVGHDGTPSISS